MITTNGPARMEAMEITNIVDPSGNKEVAIGIKIPKVPQDVPVEKERPAPTINKHAGKIAVEIEADCNVL